MVQANLLKQKEVVSLFGYIKSLAIFTSCCDSSVVFWASFLSGMGSASCHSFEVTENLPNSAEKHNFSWKPKRPRMSHFNDYALGSFHQNLQEKFFYVCSYH